jgi:perosamine synthetase
MIPVNEPRIRGNERKYLDDCIQTEFLSSEGPYVKRFEDAFSAFLQVKHGIAVCNGTAALEAALYAIDIREGDEIIMPSFTIISCAIAALRLGAKPVLVDCEPLAWGINATQIEAKITPRTRAIMAIDMYGQPCDYDLLFPLAEKHHLKIVEDFAEAQGAEYFSVYKGKKWMKCGSIGDVSATSFYANKIITTGEGGMVCTNNPIIAERTRNYRNLCFIPGNRFHHEELGYNFRMTNLQAAVGLAQCEEIETLIAIKRKNGDLYRKHLSDINGLKFHPEMSFSKSVYWMYCVELDPAFGITAHELMETLRKEGIDTRPFFKGLHEQPALHKLGLFKGENYPATTHAYRYGFYLPSGFQLTEAQIVQVAHVLRKTLSHGK